jgi:hypothetical protein
MKRHIVKFREWTCELKIGRYPSFNTTDKETIKGEIALWLDEVGTGDAIATCTTNLQGIVLIQNNVLIKEYSENEGMIAALIEAGIIKVLTAFKYGENNCPMAICKLLIEIPKDYENDTRN